MVKRKLEEVISSLSDKLRIKNCGYKTMGCVFAAHCLFGSHLIVYS